MGNLVEIGRHPRFRVDEATGLYQFRIGHGWTVPKMAKAIAEEVGWAVPASLYAAWERGEFRPPKAVRAALQRLDERTAIAPDTDQASWGRSDDRDPLNPSDQAPNSTFLMELEDDSRSMDALVAIGKSYQQQYEITPPRDLISKVHDHLSRLRHVPKRRSRAARNNLGLAVGETAVLAGRLHTRLRNYRAANRHLELAQSTAIQIGNTRLLALTHGARGILHTNIDSGRPYGRRLTAIGLLDEANRLSGLASQPTLQAWILAHRAEEHAAAGDAAAANRDMDLAEDALGRAHQSDDGLFALWNSTNLLGYRGCCAVLLNTRDSLRVLEEAHAHANPALLSQRSAIMIDLATAHARLQDPQQSSDILEQVFDLANEAHLPEILRRIMTVRNHELGSWSHEPFVRRLDERVRSSATLRD